MNTRATTQDVTIGDQTYRLAKMDARTGSWMFAFLAGKASPEGGAVSAMQLVSAFNMCTKREFGSIQADALKQVFLLSTDGPNTFPTALIAPDGSITSKELQEDPATIFQLTVKSIMFNLTPFFTGSESSPAPEAV